MQRRRRAAPIEVAGLGVRYPARRNPALDAVDVEIPPGERILLAGPSGSGKSTLALTIAGLIPGSIEAEIRGSVLLDGVPTGDLLPGAATEHVGVVFQDPTSQLTMPRVEDEVAFGLENVGRPEEAMPAAVDAALRAVDLLDRRTWQIDRLSGGQQQRVVLAATLAMGTGILVLDEPAAHLDPRSADGLYAWIHELCRGRERTVITVEHALDRVVAGFVERCLVLDAEGRVALDGPIGDVLGTSAGARRCEQLGVWLPASVRLALLLGAEGPLPLGVGAAAEWLVAEPQRLERIRAAGSGVGAPDASGGPSVLEARGLTVRYRSPGQDHVALRDAGLDVRPGELVALVGPNGSGKSTLLRAVSGLAPLESGRVIVGSVAMGRNGPDPELVGHVFQNPEAGILADTVADEVAYGPRALGWEDARVDRSVADVLERFGLAGLAGANPFTLSQGQKRRLSIAAATIVRPQVLVLDEPTYGQDARSAAALVDEIATIRRDGTAVLIATHDVELVAEVADRVVGMAGGRILADVPSGAFLVDDRLLELTAQVRPPLQQILAEARALGADAPGLLRWAELERAAGVSWQAEGPVPLEGEPSHTAVGPG
jgi:energy-coupling factor transport system ATP-binding protein